MSVGMFSLVVECLGLLSFLAFWLQDYYDLQIDLDFEKTMTARLTEIFEKAKPESEKNDLSALEPYNAQAVAKFSKMKRIYKRTFEAEDTTFEFSDDEEEEFEDDSELREYRLKKCAEFLDRKTQDKALTVYSLITGKRKPIQPHRHWCRGLAEHQLKVLTMALTKRATANCTNVQNNLKMFRFVNANDYCIVNDKQYNAIELMKVYIQWESDQVIYYANCLLKGSGVRIWHTSSEHKSRANEESKKVEAAKDATPKKSEDAIPSANEL